MMAIRVVFGLLTLTWLGVGLALVVAPASWLGWVRHTLLDPLRRLLLTQGMMLAGLVLIVGPASLRGRWLWNVVGVLVVVKGLALLALSDAGREAWLASGERLPASAYRLAGVLNVALATLLAIDILR
jgi:hypothetical protein